MRVVGGRLRGRILSAPKSGAIRPTSDRVRESIFNILSHGESASPMDGMRVIDLFAGTGALGIEALSRGARFCLFVESDPTARGLIRSNVEAFSLTGVCKIFRRDATDLGPVGTMAQFDTAFLDPPYSKGLVEQALISLRDGGWLVCGAVVAVEEHAKATLSAVPGFDLVDQRVYGDTQVVFLKHTLSRERT